ncbi:NACHT domain-containing protein [Streptomyces sp. yr375]|uniref:NACHT domain-containing protein n=1 Tax=Streptomyces sp. yr375 TaxID=1761906 RepID=UPI0008D07477|nr:NACHT domain-containing protein [Streptomyces sp. yr375]SER57656.1 NACHT domain-containing protein [Streptomyces sp. yr375]
MAGRRPGKTPWRVSHTGPAETESGVANSGILFIAKQVQHLGAPAPESLEDWLRKAAEVVARQAYRDGTEQEQLRRVSTPPPIQLRFTAAPCDLVAQQANIVGTGLGEAVPQQLELAGRLDAIEDVYRRTSGRLVILGERGSGKSVVAQRLALMLLDSRRPEQDPVPIVFRLHDWDPDTALRDFLVASLAQAYNMDATGPGGVRLAEALVDEGWILPVLDGFDEISPGLYKDALKELSETSMPLVITSTTDAYARTVRGSRTLARAAVIVLTPLTPDDLRLYLPRTAQTESSATHWASLFAARSEANDGLVANPVEQALSTPLMVGLARSIYSDGGQNPEILFDTRQFPTSSAVENHLLDRFVPAVYERRGAWRTENAMRWLGYLAQRPGRRDIAWWDLADAVPKAQRSLAFAVPAALLGAVTGWLTFGTSGGTAGVAALLLLLGTLTGRSRSPVPARMALRVSGRARHVLTQLAVGPIGGLAVALIGHPMVQEWGWLSLALAGGTASGLGGLLSGLARLKDPDAEVRPLRREVGLAMVGGSAGGLAVGSVCLLARLPAPTGSYRVWVSLGFAIGLAFALGAALLAPTRLDTVVTPQALLWSNRRYALFQTVTVGTAYGLVPGVLTDPVAGLVCGPAVGIAFGVGAHSWGRWLIVVRFWLPLTGKLPWRVRAFLDDAHQRGVLRQAGAVYAFRHGRIQDNLAARYTADRANRLWPDASTAAALRPSDV